MRWWLRFKYNWIKASFTARMFPLKEMPFISIGIFITRHSQQWISFGFSRDYEMHNPKCPISWTKNDFWFGDRKCINKWLISNFNHCVYAREIDIAYANIPCSRKRTAATLGYFFISDPYLIWFFLGVNVLSAIFSIKEWNLKLEKRSGVSSIYSFAFQ